jgi:6-phosphogluconolactonase (cycloisomerase 2 family)
MNNGTGSVATRMGLTWVALGVSARRARPVCRIWPGLFALVATMGAALPVSAQLNQPFVFDTGPGPGPGVSAYIRNDTTGALTPVSGSPFPSRVPTGGFALDFKGRFLFSASSNTVSMFTVDANTGAVQEVATSPFATSATSNYVLVATESTGQYVLAVDSTLPSIDVFKIDAIHSALVPIQTFYLSVSPGSRTLAAAATDPRGHAVYVYLTSANTFRDANLEAYTVNPATGLLFNLGGSGGSGSVARFLVVDPQGAFLIAEHGQLTGFLDCVSIDPTSGTLSLVATRMFDPSGTYPGIALDSNGKFLYVTVDNSLIHLYSPTSLTELPNSPLTRIPTLPLQSWTPDPTGPFMYVSGDKTYQVDAQTGVLSVAQPTSAIGPGSAFSRPPLGQPIVGPAATLNPATLSFGSVTLGQTTTTQMIQITSTGDQALSLNSITVTGDVADFPETDDCHAPTVLQPGKFCTAQVAFSPTAAVSRSANLTITDNASPKMLSATLLGTGVTPAPAVTLVPGSLDFGTQTQGTTSQAKTVTLTNSGTATLQISSVTLSGANVNDFSMTNMCAGNMPVNGTCTISATFSPLAQGFRSATIVIADNAQNPTQSIAIGGNGTAAVTPSGTTTQNVAAGQTAAYPLTLTPGAGYSGTVSLICTGAPVGATCLVPASVQVTNGTPAAFSVTVKTSGPNHAALPYSNKPRFTPFSQWPMLYSLALLLMALLAFSNRSTQVRAKRLAWSSALATIVMFTIFSVAGCGGAGGAPPPPPPPVVTPPGTFTLTVTPAATSPSGKPLQLSPIQLTLNVTQ